MIFALRTDTGSTVAISRHSIFLEPSDLVDDGLR
jgi:hypothetical protein